MFQLKKLQRKYAALLQKVTAQHIFLNQKIDLWKFSHPERATIIETKKHTIDRSLQQINTLLTQEPVDIPLVSEKISDVEKLFESLQDDIQPRWQFFFKLFSIAIIIILLFKPYFFNITTVSQGTCEPTLLVGDTIVVNRLAYVLSSPQRGDLVLIQNPQETETLSDVQRWWQKYVGIKINSLNLPASASTTIARIVGLSGETISGKIEQNIPTIYVNENKLSENVINQYPLIAIKQKNVSIKNDTALAQLINPTVNNSSIRWISFDENESFKNQPFYKISESDVLINPKTTHPFYKKPYKKDSRDEFLITITEKNYWCMNDSRRNTHDSRTFGAVPQKNIIGKISGILYSIDSQEESWILELLRKPKSFFSHQMRKNRFLQRIK
ncbi:signal peptidase I [Candidatus Dependentiae bacterium]|nr:signal peptidase I [Candidatus Dependentiae bacterium]